MLNIKYNMLLCISLKYYKAVSLTSIIKYLRKIYKKKAQRLQASIRVCNKDFISV